MIYLTEGNIPLNAAYDDDIVQEDNSTYQLTFKFPTNDILWQRLREEKFLTADDLHGEQDFVIFEVEKKHGYIQVYANQVMTLLNHYVVNPINLDRVTGSTALSQFAGSITRDNPFSFFSDIDDRHTFNTDTKNAMEALTKDKHSILGQWGGDLVRHSYQVRLLKNGGSENESLFMYKKNLSSYQHKTSTKSLKTRITFITTIRGEGGNPVDKHYKVVLDSPLINKYSQIYEDVVEVNDQDVTDEESLRKYGKQYFRTTLCDMLEDSIEIDVVGQSDVPVQMFDVVSVYHEYYDLDVRKKITKYNYSPMAKKLKSIGFGEFKSGLANAIGNVVSDAIKGETQQFQSNFEQQLAREIKNADLAFDRKKEELTNQFTDEVNAIKAKAEENKRALSDEIDRRFHDFSPAGFDEAKAKAEEALKKAGASYNLAEEAKYIASVNDIALGGLADNFNKQSGKLDSAIATQTALSGDLDTLKKTVASEVNQASEHRRTTTDALSRMTGQMSGFATKSEVRQDVTGLTETFAKLKTDTNDLISGAKSEITLAKTEFQKTAEGLSSKMSTVESYVGQDGQRQEALRRYTREESAKQATAVRELVTRDFVGKSAYQEDVKGLERRFSAISTQTNNDIASKIAQYKQTVDGQFASIASQISGKVNQTDFQRVRETSQLYERILGNTENGIADKVARMALTNQLFQVEISKYATQGGPNLIKNSGNPQDNKNWGYWEFGQNPAVRVGTHDYFFKNKRNLFYVVNKTRETVPASTSRFSIKRNTVYSVALTIFNTWNMTGATIYFLGRKAGENQTFTTSVTLADNIKFSSNEAVRKNYTFNSGECDEGFIRIDNNGTTDSDTAMLLFGDVDVYEGTTIRPWQPHPEDAVADANAKLEATQTKMTQLAGSWSVQNLNSAGDIIAGINVGANGNNRIIGRATHITGDTLIDNAVIKSAMVDKLKTANFEAGSVTTNILGAEAVTAEKVKFDTAFIQRLVSQQAFINELFAKQATITKIQSIDFTGNHIKGGKISSLNGVTDFDLQTGWIDMNKEAVGIRNRFDGKPMQFLIFGQGSINGVPSAYTQLMSNRNGQTGIEHTSAGIQIWNGRLGDNIQTAITFYGKSMDFIPNSQGGGVSLNTETRDFKGLNNITATGNISTSGMITANNIFLSGYGNNNLKALFNDIYKNLALLHKNKETKNNYTYSMYGPID
nr:MAG TPA: Neck appendage protein [Caudoviricetes sp.]